LQNQMQQILSIGASEDAFKSINATKNLTETKSYHTRTAELSRKP